MRNFKRLSPFFIILVLLMSGAKPPTEKPKPKDVRTPRQNRLFSGGDAHTL